VRVSSLPLNDGWRIPRLGFGVWQVTGRQTVPVVSAALEVGHRHLDTASADGNVHGIGQGVSNFTPR
jgi:2,5-diketo-D-gluconate reductase A